MYRKSRRTIALERKRRRCASMRAAKERKRLAETFSGPAWVRVRTMIVGVWAHQDGRHVGLWIDGQPWVVGSERTMRSKLAKLMYRRAVKSCSMANRTESTVR